LCWTHPPISRHQAHASLVQTLSAFKWKMKAYFRNQLLPNKKFSTTYKSRTFIEHF
jgi:hypothetical protein